MRAFFEGNVQGVGFRYSVRHIAKGFDVTGWIKNLRDGRVEMQVEGTEEEVRAFLDAILQSELRAHIRKHDVATSTNASPTRGFEIRYE